MLAHVLDDLPIAVEITRTRMQASELVSLVHEREFTVVCIADLPPSPPVKDALSRQAAPRRITRGASPGRAVGTASAGG
jgi:hypothetical protein